MIEMSVVHVPL